MIDENIKGRCFRIGHRRHNPNIGARSRPQSGNAGGYIHRRYLSANVLKEQLSSSYDRRR